VTLGPPADGPDQREAVAAARRHTDLSLEQLWLRYFELGGSVDQLELEAYLEGLHALPASERDVLAVTVNERLDELAWNRRVPLSRPFRDPRPTSGPLRSMVDLLEAAHCAPPGRLADLVRQAGRSLGVDIAVFVVDREQRHLVPLAVADGPARSPLRVEGTLAGRAYQTLLPLPSDNPAEPRLWIPLEDGIDRLGVLEVRTATPEDCYDPALRDQCRWLALLVGHLVASVGRYGDELEASRRTRRPEPSAELVWSQLPPTTAGTDALVLAGSLEPTYEVGGDAFDFALSEDTVSLAIFDAMGHGMSAGLLVSAALAAYRSARRDRRGVYEQAGSIDEVVAECFSGSAFVTGVLAELDTASGRLRYVAAGHPPPLLLRSRKVVKSLEGGRRVPFGIGNGAFSVAQEVLQPGDWLALYTDGITEARDANGAWFGEERLVELLARAMAAGRPPPETVRRLTRAVLDHQGGQLQDDATVLLAAWSDPRRQRLP
jgi:hypothetical protein